MAKMTSRRPRLIIHLGNKKTGSTSLQGFLAQNEKTLREKNVNFVTFGRRHISHNPLFRLLRGAQAGDTWTAIAKEVDTAPDMLHLMSSEVFFDQTLIRNIADQMPEHLQKTIQLVVYLRRQDSYLESMYKQLTQNGRIHATPAQFINTLGIELGGYASILSTLEDVVGKGTIVVRPFERSRMKNGDTTADFLNIMGLSSSDPDFVQPMHPANETMSRATTQLLGAFSRNSKLNAREIAREMLRGDEDRPKRSGDVFRKAERQEIMKQFAAENAQIAARYLPEEIPSLFSLDDLAPGAPDPYPSPEEEMQLIAAAQEKTAAAIGRIDARERGKLFRG